MSKTFGLHERGSCDLTDAPLPFAGTNLYFWMCFIPVVVSSTYSVAKFMSVADHEAQFRSKCGSASLLLPYILYYQHFWCFEGYLFHRLLLLKSDRFFCHFSLDFNWIPLLIIVQLVIVVGTKLQHIIATLALENAMVKGPLPSIRPRDELFWFKTPTLLLKLIHFILFQNAFELATFIWFWVSAYTAPFNQVVCLTSSSE